MATVELTMQNFEASPGNESDTVLVDLSGVARGPRRAFAPIFEAASEQHPELMSGRWTRRLSSIWPARSGFGRFPR